MSKVPMDVQQELHEAGLAILFVFILYTMRVLYGIIDTEHQYTIDLRGIL